MQKPITVFIYWKELEIELGFFGKISTHYIKEGAAMA